VAQFAHAMSLPDVSCPNQTAYAMPRTKCMAVIRQGGVPEMGTEGRGCPSIYARRRRYAMLIEMSLNVQRLLPRRVYVAFRREVMSPRQCRVQQSSRHTRDRWDWRLGRLPTRPAPPCARTAPGVAERCLVVRARAARRGKCGIESLIRRDARV